MDGSIISRLQQQEVLTLGGGREKSTPMKNCRDKWHQTAPGSVTNRFAPFHDRFVSAQHGRACLLSSIPHTQVTKGTDGKRERGLTQQNELCIFRPGPAAL